MNLSYAKFGYCAHKWILALAILVGLTVTGKAIGGEADVLKAVATAAANQFAFDVTVRSNDKGWGYYCDRFEIVSADGQILGTRILLHPHETEQPFTRSLGGVDVPVGLRTVIVRAKMKPSGEGGDVVTVVLPGR